MTPGYFILYLVFASFSLTSFTSCNLTTKKVRQHKADFEGFVILDVKTFIDMDGNGVLQKSLSGKDSIMFISDRKMYLQNNYLIDIITNKNFNKESFIKSDTLSYDFYDLVKQEYILFDELSLDAKTIKKGSMAKDGSFSNTASYDPMNGIADSAWQLSDTVINGKRQGVITFNNAGITDSSEREIAKRTKFWVDYETKNFPLQLSYILSKKLDGGFIYKMQNPFPDGKTVMITSLDYKPAKLSDTLTSIIERWKQIAGE